MENFSEINYNNQYFGRDNYDYVQDFHHNRRKPPLPMSSSNEATTSTANPMVLEVRENQYKGGNERKVVTKSLTRIKTMASILEESQLVGRERKI